VAQAVPGEPAFEGVESVRYRKEAREGRLDSTYVGKRRLVRRSDLDQLLDS
jgi:hypothetical protein